MPKWDKLCRAAQETLREQYLLYKKNVNKYGLKGSFYNYLNPCYKKLYDALEGEGELDPGLQEDRAGRTTGT